MAHDIFPDSQCGENINSCDIYVVYTAYTHVQSSNRRRLYRVTRTRLQMRRAVVVWSHDVSYVEWNEMHTM